ncbi:MAG: stage V sporulation T C-terminal domain-containing protein, partial [Eubacterium sp.]|uniref:stage V sporulation T C-terminal domain-containing protein n=1 Tax=Eubacterium sp. TaxID=142586 RepID=UPI003995B900
MKATGIVRRIDDLGRVVVPKEIRRTLRIREGDPMEIFTNREGEIILKKYSPIGEIDSFAKQYAESLAQVSGCRIVISDRDQVIAIAGGAKKELMGKNISTQLEKIINNRKSFIVENNSEKCISLVDGVELK